MIPFRHTPERVHLTICSLRRERRDEREYAVVMNPDMLIDLLTDVSAAMGRYESVDGHRQAIYGLPIVVDSTLRRGQIVLRHEVEA